MNRADYDRLMSLLADQATEGLSPEGLTELKQLLEKHPELHESYLEIAAAAVDLSAPPPEEQMPPSLREKVIADAAHYFGERESLAKRDVVELSGARHRYPRPGRWQRAGWYAAAACLLLALAGWWPRLTKTGSPPAPTLRELRARLMERAPDLVNAEWAPTAFPGATGVRGDVVWSNSLQEGFMRFQGLPANDPAASEYQLWIFDASRDERYPVDGGVFDIDPETGEAIVRIEAKVQVSQPKLFAITVEEPGGVVVSKRDRLVLTAKVN